MTNRISRVRTPMPRNEFSHTAAIMGYACRLPGAADIDGFWSLLSEGRCAVSQISAQRWAPERFLHPRAGEPGRSYTFAAGVLDDIYAFDPGAFGLSPREVEQVDPQQRILLELTREAFEDANIALSEVEGKPVGVFVGASSLDYSIRFASDTASVDSHFVTGNALSIISNRISFAFGFTGPSLTIDTACSSSLVAFDRAVRAIEAGEVDYAVVAGVNILSSPYNFIGFARAGMLSPTGLCRPFSARADGYVRSEGAVVMVLRRQSAAAGARQAPRAIVMGTGTNSDGRTVGIALPNTRAQQRLIEDIYAARGIDPEHLAFIEAHGTGTRVGDPAEANAIGQAVGIRRSRPLPIGSVKSNLGHLEPASGLVGLLKSLLALHHRLLPASLHLDQLNETIPFEALNLIPASMPRAIEAHDGVLGAAVSSFGFGGTNAHAVFRLPEADELPPAAPAAAGRVLTLSAASRKALAALAARYADTIEAGAQAGALANAVAYGRSLMPFRLALAVDGAAKPAAALRRFAADMPEPGIAQGVADRSDGRVAFVFAGNGGQHVGMGRAAYLSNAGFRDTVREIDARFAPLAGWSIAEAIEAPAGHERLEATEIAQPLLFAIGIGVARVLMDNGCVPSAVLGHSVGEIPAAYIAGALDLQQAVDLIYWRSRLQGTTRGMGTMAALMTSAEEAEKLIAPPLTSSVVVAAINSPNTVTIAGPSSEVTSVLRRARHNGIAGKRIDLDYPFHSPLMEQVEAPLRTALETLRPRDGAIPFFSTVTGDALPGSALDAGYWWHNVRDPVLFSAAVRHAAESAKIDLFLEIGPRPVLTGHMRETLEGLSGQRVVLGSLQEKTPAHRDPVLHTLLSCFVEGAPVDREKLFGPPRPLGGVRLPLTPWQRQTIVVPDTAEAVDVGGLRPVHPLLGARLRDDAREWRNLLDPLLVPYLADHKVNGTIVVPGAGLAEMALAAGRDLYGPGPLALEEFDILHALTLSEEASRETLVRISATGQVEILSRPRFAPDWSLHARGQISPSAAGPLPLPEAVPAAGQQSMTGPALYAAADRMGLNYGPQFRLVDKAEASGRRISLALEPAHADQGYYRTVHVLHPTVLDAALHGLLLAADAEAVAEKRVYLPARFGALHVFSDAPPVRAELEVVRASARSMLLDIRLHAADGAVVARLDGARLRAAVLTAGGPSDTDFRQSILALPSPAGRPGTGRSLEEVLARVVDLDTKQDDFLLLSAFAQALAHEAVTTVCGVGAAALADIDVEALVESGRLAPAARGTFLALLSILGTTGLAGREGQVWTVVPDSGLPAPDAILREVLRDAPERAAEVTIGAYLCDHLADHLTAGAPLALAAPLAEHWDVAAPAADALRALAATLVEAVTLAAARAPARILVVERHGAVANALLPLAQAGRIVLAVDGLDGKARDALAARHPVLAPHLAPASPAKGDAGYDLVLCADMRPAVLEVDTLAARLVAAVAPTGRIAALHAQPSPFSDLVTAVITDDDGDTPPAAAAVCARLAAAGAGVADLHLAGFPEADIAVVLAAAPPEAQAAPAPADERLVAALRDLLEGTERPAALAAIGTEGGEIDHLTTVGTGAPAEAWRSTLPGNAKRRARILYPLTAADAGPARIAASLTGVTTALEAARASAAKPEIWLMVRGGGTVDGGPLSSALWAFGRVAANEFADIDIRLVGIDAAAAPDTAAAALAALMLAPPRDRELRVEADGIGAVRVAPARPAPAPAGDGDVMALLEARPGSMDRLTWTGRPRRAPGPGEVEIAVAASALNFRDVMFAQGLIGDEMLENGFTGPSLGFECAGTVVRVGADVTGVAAGDRVMTFAPAAFATHVVVRADMALAVPDTVGLAAAATIPVAFLTAWYGLITQAQLKRGEWVLVHGAAGGVGLAALQIAKWAGAHIVATAGTPEKRALARLAGADIVLDSRSLAFVDAIGAEIGGVDVVLNSLAGEAMERSIKVLKPFGRFVELGKRDYINNTGIGLRPFARNLSYFGVDTDQLIAARPDFLPQMFGELVRLFAEGEFTALPFRAFAAEDVSEAFRLMQGAGHVGKILIRPPARIPAVARTPEPFRAAADGVHLVVGGTGGFGFETAMWLADNGAAAVVVASRGGTMEPEAAARAAAVSARGVAMEAVALDVRDAPACSALIKDLERRFGRVCGVVHAAMVLDDGLLTDLDAARITRVLEPKISGAVNMDAATRTSALDYFVLFSSATTLVGNPGQASYVAGNAFLEGIARARRAAGLPALAVAWGAISDVGVLARETAVNEKLRRRIGRHAMTAATALSHLGHLIAATDTHPAAVTCAFIDWASAGELAVVKAPAFAALHTGLRGDRTMAGTADLESLIAGQSPAAARLTVAKLLADEIGKILRLPPDSIELARPLTEIGMDSLMSLELDMEVQRRFGIELPILALGAGATLMDVAEKMLGRVRDSTATSGTEAPIAVISETGLIDRHVDMDIDDEALARMSQKVITEREQAKGGLL